MKLFAPVLLLALGSCQPVDFEYADGAPGRFADWQGHWVVINYWAEWCAPCRMEIPQLNALHRALGGHEMLVVGVNYDAVAGDALRALTRRMGIGFPVMTQDPRARYGYDLPVVLPTTVIIDPAGTVVATLVGPQTEASIKSVLGVSAPL
jgi:thiol-disulfide isomerase/thioredoxin